MSPRTGISVAPGEEGDPVRLVLAAILTFLLGWWFLAVHAAGEISIRAGPRLARGAFSADRLTDPVQFYGALAFIGVLFLVALAAFASTAWDLVAAWRRDSGRS